METNGRIYHDYYPDGTKNYIIYSFFYRTDNDIKNHFYSTLRRSLRRINKELGDRNS
jgi:hypothetical protein